MSNRLETPALPLKKFLRAEGISQDKAAEMLGITRPTLSTYFGLIKPPEDFLQSAKKLWPDAWKEEAQNVVNEPEPEHKKAPESNPGAEGGEGYREAVAALKIAVEAKEQARLAEAEAKEAYKKMLAMKEEQEQYLAANFVERDEFEGIAAALGGLIVASRKSAKQLTKSGLIEGVDVDKEMKVFLDRPRRGTLSGVDK